MQKNQESENCSPETVKPRKLSSLSKEYLWGCEEWKLSYLQEGMEEVPLLIKIIKAKEALSVQVHPNDEYATAQEQQSGKTEMWYVLDCEPDAFLYYGLKHKISENEFRKRIQNDTILEVCRKMPVKKGDVFYIPAGLLHAIGKGITVAEIQQSSNLTYRVYDYHRLDANMQPRELHIEKAAQVAGFLPPLQGHHPMGSRVQQEGYQRTLLVQCPYFTVYRYEIEDKMQEAVTEEFRVLLILEGEGSLLTGEEEMRLQKGDCIYLSEHTDDYRVRGRIELLQITK